MSHGEVRIQLCLEKISLLMTDKWMGKEWPLNMQK